MLVKLVDPHLQSLRGQIIIETKISEIRQLVTFMKKSKLPHRTMMVHLHGQHDWTENHLVDTPLRASVWCFQRGVTKEGGLTLNVGSTSLWAGILE